MLCSSLRHLCTSVFVSGSEVDGFASLLNEFELSESKAETKEQLQQVKKRRKEFIGDLEANADLMQAFDAKYKRVLIKSNKTKKVILDEPVSVSKKNRAAALVAGLIGAGNFSKSTLGPILLKSNSKIKTVVTSKGISGTLLARRLKASVSSTSLDDIFNDEDINTVIISTRHNSHADLVVRALESGKHIFVEKPLALNLNELKNIVKVYNALEHKPKLFVGFNRRFSPLTKKVRELLAKNVVGKPLYVRGEFSEYLPDCW